MNKKKKICAAEYGIDISKMPKAVYENANSLSAQKIKSIKIHNETVMDFLAIYYHFKFVEHLSNSEIARRLNKDAAQINHRLRDLNWNYADDFETNMQMYLDKQRVNEPKRQLLINDAKKINITAYSDLTDILNDPKKTKQMKSAVKNGTAGDCFSNHKDFIITLYYAYCVKKESIEPLCEIFDWHVLTAQAWLGKLGIRRTMEEGKRLKVVNKSQDYGRTGLSRKKTILDNQLKNLNSGSNNENILRAKLANIVYDFFDMSIYDVVVGCSSTGILGGKEIDIPVFIYNIKTNEVFRFAIEHNGPFHNEADDQKKKDLAEQRGWVYLPLYDKNSAFSNDVRKLTASAHDLCEKMKNTINKTETHSSNFI